MPSWCLSWQLIGFAFSRPLALALPWQCLPIGPLRCVQRGGTCDDVWYGHDDRQDASRWYACCLVWHFYISRDDAALCVRASN